MTSTLLIGLSQFRANITSFPVTPDQEEIC